MDFPFTCYLAGGPNLATPWNRKCLQVSYLTGGVWFRKCSVALFGFREVGYAS
jgi:hypothetical protein